MAQIEERNLMYELKKNQENLLDKYTGTSEEEKLQKGVNLLESQWELLDKLAEDKGKSRNQVLRDILESFFQGEKPI